MPLVHSTWGWEASRRGVCQLRSRHPIRAERPIRLPSAENLTGCREAQVGVTGERGRTEHSDRTERRLRRGARCCPGTVMDTGPAGTPGERQGVEDDATPPLRAAGAVCCLRDTGQGTHVAGKDQHGFQTHRAGRSP